jgi:selenocysteine-specific elongation factor
MRSIVIGTAGHIDHGKSALVKAITGIEPSRLNEEKRRGITIDLGFAFREVVNPDGSSLRLSFVDVPGHSGFIRNMLAGAAGIDMVLLVISAEEGVKPQTREHLAICTLLGVQRGLAVLTKADTVTPERLAETRDEVSRFLKGSFLESGPAWPLPVSARTGEGIDELIDRIVALAARIDPRDAAGPVCLPIDRSFAMRGFGTVVTGTLLSGAIDLQQKLSLEPGGRSIRVRSIQTHGQNLERAAPGSRVALNLAGIDHLAIARGDTIVTPDTLVAVAEIDAAIALLPDTAPLKHGAQVTFHAHTSDCAASVLLYSRSRLEAGSDALARLKLRHPVVLAPGDRFILRLPSPSETIAGGMVLDAHPLAKQSRQDALRWLKSLRQAEEDPESLLMHRVSRRSEEGLDRSAAIREMAITSSRLDELVHLCILANKLASISDSRLVDRALYDSALRRVQTELARYHADSPAQEGIRRGDLQSRCRLPSALFTSVLDQMSASKTVIVKGDFVSAAGFAVQLSAGDRRLLESIANLYAQAGLEILGLRDVAPALRIDEKELQRLLAVLLRQETLVKIGNDAYVHNARLSELRQKLGRLRGRPIDVIEFKRLTGLSRKHAIPWLEYLDREHITRRVGDARLVL